MNKAGSGLSFRWIRKKEEIYMTVQQANPLGYERVSKLLMKFAIPSIVAMLVSSLYNIVDLIFIGQGVGVLGNAATTVAFPFTTICLALALLLGVGSATCYSLYLGENKPDKAANIVGNGLIVMTIVGLLYLVIGESCMNVMLPWFGSTADNFAYAAEYSRIILIGMPFLILSNGLSNLCRADGSPNYSMTCMIIGAIINCILDPLFIFVFKWGMSGAAWATIIGQIISCLFATRYIKMFKHVSLTKEHFRLNPQATLQTVKLGLTPSLNQLCILIIQVVLNNSLRHYGMLSIYGADIPIASCGIAMKLNGLFISVLVGLSQGTQPIIGFNYGAKNYLRVKKTVLQALTIIVTMGVLVELLFQFFPEQLVLMFGHGDELYVDFSTKFLRIYLSTICITGIQAQASNYFSSIGQPGKGVFLSVSRQVLFAVPLVLIFPMWWGIDGILYTQPVADVLAMVISIIMLVISFRKLNKMEAEKEAGSNKETADAL